MFTPPVGFHFKVEVLGLTPVADDLRFVEVGGLAIEVTTEELAEGGENRFVQRYPGRSKYGDLVLKRGLLKGSKVWEWAQNLDLRRQSPGLARRSRTLARRRSRD